MRDYQAKQPGCTYWSPAVIERIASQVPHIRHWTISQASYDTIPNLKATWFIDPPYQVAGRAYRFHDIDYPALGEWCRGRSGQVVVCENAGADWLPFRPFRTIKGLEGRRGGKKSEEAIWTNDEHRSRDTAGTLLIPDHCAVLREDDPGETRQFTNNN